MCLLDRLSPVHLKPSPVSRQARNVLRECPGGAGETSSETDGSGGGASLVEHRRLRSCHSSGAWRNRRGRSTRGAAAAFAEANQDAALVVVHWHHRHDVALACA